MCKIRGPSSFIFSKDIFLQVSELEMPFLKILLQKAKHILNQKHVFTVYLSGFEKNLWIWFPNLYNKTFFKIDVSRICFVLKVPFCDRRTTFYKAPSLPVRNTNKFRQSLERESD